MREGIKQYLNRQEDMAMCAEAGELGTAMEAVQELEPDLVLLEVKLRCGDVLDFIKNVRARFPKVRMLILSQQEEALYAERALRAGAQGYVMKEEPAEEVLNAIRKVLKGELFVSRAMASSLLNKLLQAPAVPSPRPLDGLSDRELQVFNMLGVGLGSRQIATQLNLSIKTIETYRENIKHKFGLKTASELVRHATHWIQNGAAGTVHLHKDISPAICLPINGNGTIPLRLSVAG